ncbi:uncharacterized protein LOC106668301 isoform X1 [Cimex lectularius]|uniref:Osiris 9 n=1 Tax=Cimex lectularius TaxID=79782 RepID=A0A8I6RTZ2_CIMLE|nr:uncharacterized protein LOC106668301 isoform X1 [Cimex lectularius]
MHLVLLVTSIALAGCSPVLGQGVLPAESSISLDPLVTLVGCLRDAKPGYCLQRRALGFFESWLTNSGDEDDVIPNDDEDGGVKLPAGLSPYWSKMVDSVAERIAGIYDDKDEDEDEDEQSAEESEARNLVQDSSLSQVEDGRGHKKKKKIKAIKKAIIKLVLIALLIKHKLKMLLVAFQTFLQFKGALLATILVIIHAVKLWIEMKHKHHPQKVIYYENAHHQHHYDDHHHHDHDHGDDHHHGWSLWGRSGYEPSSTPPPNFYPPGLAGYFSKRSSDLAYSAYTPKDH